MLQVEWEEGRVAAAALVVVIKSMSSKWRISSLRHCVRPVEVPWGVRDRLGQREELIQRFHRTGPSVRVQKGLN